MKRQICLAVSILPILLAYAVPVFGDLSDKENINFFDAVFQNGEVSVNWQISGQYETPTEIDYYAIERNTGSRYMVIGGVNEKEGTSGIREYFFLDENLPVKSLIQYRLKVVYKDGSEIYSSARNIYLQDVVELKLTPNPFKESINVSLPYQTESPFRIRIFNIKGEEVLKADLRAKSEEYVHLDLNTSGLLPGVYIFSMTSGADSWQKKIFKQ